MNPDLPNPSNHADSTEPALNRLSSNIPGLDQVLDGGFFQSGVYMLHGAPGSGKTIFANQVCYGHVAAGGRALYVTLLAESHSRMLQHLRRFSFFDDAAIPDRLSYVSAFSHLEADGLKGLMDVLRREMRARKVSVLILDGLVAAAEAAPSDRELKKFIHELQTSAVFHGCTVLLLTSGNVQHVDAEHTMVDGLIELEDRLFDARAERYLNVRKFRGGPSMRGKQAFVITDDGIRVFPRVEALFGQQPQRGTTKQVVTTGIHSLDALIEAGGLPSESATVVIGSTGTGKTTMGLQFLGACTPADPGLFFGFFESPDRLRVKAKSFGIDLQALEASGALTLVWHPQGEHVLDELGHHLIELCAERGIRRVMIDGLSGFFESVTYPERMNRFFSCLVNELRSRSVTVMMALETQDVVGSTIATPYGVSGFVDNLFFLRFVEERGVVKRLVTIIKMRDTAYNVGLHVIEMGSTGMSIAGLHTSDGDVIPTARAVSR